MRKDSRAAETISVMEYAHAVRATELDAPSEMAPERAVSEAFDRILRDYHAPLRRLVAAYEPDPDGREDLLQDILFALWKALPSFRGDCSERTFIYRVAHNRALTHRRRAGRRPVVTLEHANDVADPSAASDRRAEAGDMQERLLAAVQRLSPSYRQIVLLRLEDLDNKEIAEILGASENAVAIRLTRARKELMRMLNAEGLE